MQPNTAASNFPGDVVWFRAAELFLQHVCCFGSILVKVTLVTSHEWLRSWGDGNISVGRASDRKA